MTIVGIITLLLGEILALELYYGKEKELEIQFRPKLKNFNFSGLFFLKASPKRKDLK